MPTRIISWNVNGIRAALKKGFVDYVESQQPDILCLQETKAHPDQLEHPVLTGYHDYWNSAEKKPRRPDQRDTVGVLSIFGRCALHETSRGWNPINVYPRSDRTACQFSQFRSPPRQRGRVRARRVSVSRDNEFARVGEVFASSDRLDHGAELR